MKPPVKFSKKDPKRFFQTIHQKVNAYFEEQDKSKNGNFAMYLKAFFLLGLFFVPFGFVLTNTLPVWGSLLMYVLMAFGMSGIGLAIMHDANHGAFSKHKIVNTLFGHSLDLVGGSSFTWRVQHNVLHHSYTNIYELDEDIEDKPFLRLSPNGKYKKYHRFQHIYAILIYSLATASWVITKDFKQLRRYNKNGMTNEIGTTPLLETIKMIAFKSFYYFYILVLPILLGVPAGLVIGGFFLFHAIAGIFITCIFQMAHVVEGPEHHDLKVVQQGTMENTWALHQLSTTANFATKNRFLTWFVGGLNFQIEHHLFPHICHIHYHKIHKIVKETALEFGLSYYEFPKFRQAFRSHLRVLKDLGNQKPIALSA